MIELPSGSMDFFAAVIQNFTIIATLLLLYTFIPEALLTRSKRVHSLAVGTVFGLAAAVSIPAFWSAPGGQVLGFNVVLVPLAGYAGGPVSTAFVAIILLAGCAASGGTLVPTDVLTVMTGVLLGSLVYYGRTWDRFPKNTSIQLVILGIGVAGIETISFAMTNYLQRPGEAPIPGAPSFLSIFPFLIASGIVTIVLGSLIIYIDKKKVTERELLEYKVHLEDLVKERTAELERVNSLQKATIESTADGIVVVDPAGVIRAYNDKVHRFLSAHLKNRDLRGMTMTTVTAEVLADPDSFSRIIEALPESAEQIVSSDIKLRNGRIFEVFVQPEKIRDRIIGRVFSFRDITDQRLAEEAITAANNKLMLLSTLTRHDIFNQLTALSAYVELAETADPAEGSNDHFTSMKKSLDVIQFQLEFTRDYEMLGLKKPGWERADTAFTKAAEAFSNKGIEFQCNTGHLEVFADPMIGQVFYNLIDNSFRHGEHISTIRLSVQQDEQDRIIIYEDNGVGVPPEEKEKIFVKGFGKHTGLGMFLIKEILSITGITIRETGKHGTGARFEIRIPNGKFRITS